MKYCITFIFVFISGSAFSTEIKTGNQLYQACNAEQKRCDTLMRAVYDTLEYRELMCPPGNITNKEVKDIIVQELQENPQTRHKPSIDLIVYWLLKLWSCK
ncbi:Rap1a/Tai family immunity protein [Kiloniella sp.]|uniref:Rap1a/Tai family immunity protein n=1 Tax=Kiloniella sp. TaxID=1938587 RepID=UPI003A925D6C